MAQAQSSFFVSREAALTAVEMARKSGQKILFTSGAFDLIHPGHVGYLEEAKALGGFLVVAVNSDSSIQRYKDPRRPICSERERARVVAALRCVDAVFLFDETNNNTNVSILKPDVYIKAGDYQKDKLSSAGIVEQNGGQVVLAQFVGSHSTTGLIERVLDRYAPPAHLLSSVPQPERDSSKAVFLDRDGTINEFVEYLSDPDKFVFIPGAIEGLKLLKEAGYKLIVTTNQPGIGLGYFSAEDFYRVTRKMLKACDAAGVPIDKVYFCPERATDVSDFRKPATGMIERARQQEGIDVSRSFVVGDMTIDLEFARRAGCRSVLVQTGHGGKDARFNVAPDLVAPDLLAAARMIVSLS